MCLIPLLTGLLTLVTWLSFTGCLMYMYFVNFALQTNAEVKNAQFECQTGSVILTCILC